MLALAKNMFLGIEIGGTKLQVGLGEADGALRALWRADVNAPAGAEGILTQIAGAVPEIFSQASLTIEGIHGIGIGFGGPVNDDTRTVIKSHQVKGWDNFPLAAWAQKRKEGLRPPSKPSCGSTMTISETARAAIRLRF